MNGKNKSTLFDQKLSKNSLIGVDSAVFIYQFEIIEPFFDLTNILFFRFSQEKIKLVTSTITLAEVFTKPFKDNNIMNVELFRSAFVQMDNLKLLPVDNNLAISAASIRAKYNFRLPDAIQIATAVAAKAQIFVTNDAKLKKVKELQIICLSDFV